MVVSLTGMVDSIPVIFTRTEDDLWTTVVPPDLNDGMYIIELTAVDNAGNQTFYVGKLYVWQRVSTQFHLIEQPYIHKLLSQKHMANCHERYDLEWILRPRTCVVRGDRFCIRIS